MGLPSMICTPALKKDVTPGRDKSLLIISLTSRNQPNLLPPQLAFKLIYMNKGSDSYC